MIATFRIAHVFQFFRGEDQEATMSESNLQKVRNALFGSSVSSPLMHSLSPSNPYSFKHKSLSFVERHHCIGRTVNTTPCYRIIDSPLEIFLQDENLNLIDAAYERGCHVFGYANNNFLCMTFHPFEDQDIGRHHNPVFQVDHSFDMFMGPITSVRFCREQAFGWMAVGGYGEVKMRNPFFGFRESNQWTLDDGYVTAVEWTSRNEIAAANDKTINMLDTRAKDDSCIALLDCSEQNPVTKMLFQAENKTLFCAGNDEVRIWDLRYSMAPLHKLCHDKVRGMDFCSKERNTLVTGGRNGAKIWNIATGNLRSAIQMPNKDLSGVKRLWLLMAIGFLCGLFQSMGNESWKNGDYLMIIWIHTGARYYHSILLYVRDRVMSLHPNGCVYFWKPFETRRHTSKERDHLRIKSHPRVCSCSMICRRQREILASSNESFFFFILQRIRLPLRQKCGERKQENERFATITHAIS
jgi:hypothetical protein